MSDNHGYPSYGAYLRSKNLHIGYCGQGGGDYSAQKAWDQEITDYKAAVAQGINPQGTQRHQIDEAVAVSDAVGRPYDAATGKFGGDYYVPSTGEFVPGGTTIKID